MQYHSDKLKLIKSTLPQLLKLDNRYDFTEILTQDIYTRIEIDPPRTDTREKINKQRRYKQVCQVDERKSTDLLMTRSVAHS